MDKAFILFGILIGSILIVENMIIRFPAYVLIWNSTAGNLALLSMAVGGIVGFGIRGMISGKSSSEYNDDF